MHPKLKMNLSLHNFRWKNRFKNKNKTGFFYSLSLFGTLKNWGGGEKENKGCQDEPKPSTQSPSGGKKKKERKRRAK